MRSNRRYYSKRGMSFGLAGMLLLVLLSSCGNGQKELNRRVTLRRNDDNPYGAHVAYEGLSWLFPDADISVAKESPQVFSGGQQRALISVATSFDATPSEVATIMNFVGDGNQLFISAFRVSDTLLRALGLRTAMPFHFMGDHMDSLTLGVYNPVDENYNVYSYPGDAYDNYITHWDTLYTSVLGRNAGGQPNFVRVSYKGGGAIYLHLAPLAFSNFFLLHKKNMAYYEYALSYLPSTVKRVIWDDYFRYNHSQSSFSTLQYIMSNDALRWAFWLLLLLFALIYGFDSKRRQRMVPVIAPLRNTSLDFVRTIGQLYFQRRDNLNLAVKMTQHFMDQVRTRYHLPVPAFDEDFTERLAYRTGYSKEQLKVLVGYMRDLQSKTYIADDELVRFHRQLEAFYKHT